MKTLGLIFSNIHDTGISELTANRTLASVPFGGRYRLIDFVLSSMVNSNINTVGVITKTNYQSLMDHVGNGKNWDLSRKNGGLIILPPYGVGQALYSTRLDALKNVYSFFARRDFDNIVMSDCASVCSIDFTKVVAEHKANHADITLVVSKKDIATHKTKRRTYVNFDDTSKITNIVQETVDSGIRYAHTHITVMTKNYFMRMLEASMANGNSDFTQDVLIPAITTNRIYAYVHEGYFATIDTIRDYYKHNLALLNKGTRDSLFNQEGFNVFTKVRDSAPAVIKDSAEVGNSMIADGCVIEGEVSNSILFRGVHVAKGAVVKNSIIFQDTVVGSGSMLNCVIADKNTKILENRILSGHETHPYFLAKDSRI